MSHVLYLHGFASSPASAKITALRPLLQPHGFELETPDLNVPSFAQLDWNALVDHAHAAALQRRPEVLVGSSMGALVALSLVQRGIIAPLVLIAPALGMPERWRPRLPPPEVDPVMLYNFALGAEAPIHRRFLEQVIEVDVDQRVPPVRTVVIMGRQDETVPFESVERRWREWEAQGLAAGSKFIEIDEGDHGLVSEAELIAREIRTAGRG